MRVHSYDRLRALLSPRSIAIVGASPKKNKIAGQLIDSLRAGGFDGAIYPVNRSYTTVQDLPCYPSVSAIGRDIDHCIISVPSTAVPDVLAECRAAGVQSAAVYTSGFREVGNQTAEQALVEAAGEMPFLGPNCMGMANIVDHVVATTSAVFSHEDTSGTVALVSQSGGLVFASTVYMGVRAGLGFTHVINFGNGAGVTAEELCRYLEADPRVQAIGVIVEDVHQVEPLTRVPWSKPLVVMKLGRTATGATMARSHTGSLAGDHSLVKAFCTRAGIALAEDVDEFITCLDIAAKVPPIRGGAAALSISGGNITLLADNFDEHGVPFATLQPRTLERLREILPDYITIHNPLDITALGYEDPSLNQAVLGVLAEDPEVGVVVPVLTTVVDYEPVAQMLVEARTRGLSIVALWTGGSYDSSAFPLLKQHEIPVVRFANTLARALAALARARAFEHLGPRIGEHTPSATSISTVQWAESAGWRLLEEADVPLPTYRTGTVDRLPTLAHEVEYPVVVKVDALTSHISAAGQVFLDIRSDRELADVAGRLGADTPLLVTRYLPGAELMISLLRDETFGPVLIVASGGTLADDTPDAQIVPLPAAETEITEAVGSTLVGKRAVAHGYDQALHAAAQVALRATARFLADSEIMQIEMNPVVLRPDGAFPVDVFVVGRPDDEH